MPDRLFIPRRFHRRYLVYCALTAITLEGSVVGIAQVWSQIQPPPVPPRITSIDDFSPGEPPETFPPLNGPQPTPEEPTPPPTPEETPTPEEIPPPSDEPEMTLVPPKPTPVVWTVKHPKLTALTGILSPDARRSGSPQTGVPGGTSNAARSTGPLPSRTGGAWRVSSKPPYPARARASHAVGDGTVFLATDASGRVVNASIGQSSGNALLDAAVVSHARLNWSGPPNAATTVSFTFRLP